MSIKRKYESTFANVKIRSLIAAERDEYLALAASSNLKSFIPEIDASKNPDLLPISFNACVVNRINKNGDSISSAEAKEVCASFINKQINIEHNRKRVVGVVLKSGYSEFGTDKPLTEEEALSMSGPYNITLGGVVWRAVSPEVANFLEEASDPSSENYDSVSASWELGFDKYKVVVLPEGEKNLSNAEKTIDGQIEIEDCKAVLKAYGGSGVKDGKNYARVLSSNLVSMGIGLTENPAAEVKGVFVQALEMDDPTEKEDEEDEPMEEEKEEEKDPSESSAQIQNQELKNQQEKSVIKNKTMKIEKIEDLTDENLKEASASMVMDVLQTEIKAASVKFAAEKEQLQKTTDEALQNAKDLEEAKQKLSDELASVQASLKELQDKESAREAQELFSQRMNSFDEKFNLSSEDRKVIASQIRDLSEDEFVGFAQNMDVLLSAKAKGAQAESEASTVENDSAESAIDTITKDKEAEGSVSHQVKTAEPTTLTEKYKNAFSSESVKISY